MMVPCSHTLCSFVQLTDALVIRCKIVLIENFEAEAALQVWVRGRVSVLCGFPAISHMMLTHPNFYQYDLSSSLAGYKDGQISHDNNR
jgi:acyl-CoA synthetase (AMP-forming)/AMP-acid ligase II